MDSHPKLAPLGSASSSRELNEIASLTTITEAELRQATVLTAVRRRIGAAFRSKRDAKAMHSIFALWASRGITYALRFAIVGLSIRILGHERYGLWLTIGSLTAWLGLSDVGISGALVSRVATHYALGEFDVVRRFISSANRLYWGVAAVATGIAITLAAFPQFIHLLGVKSIGLDQEGRWLVVITGLILGVTIRAGSVAQVCTALNEGYLNSYARTLSWLISLAVLISARSLIHSTISYALIISLPTACEPLILGYFLYRRPPYSSFRPAPKYFNRLALRNLLGLSFPMFQTQIADLVVTTSANILIANRLGLLEVAKFAVPWSLFWAFAGPLGSIFYSYWPPFIQAFTNGEYRWLRRRFLRMLAITTAAVSAGDLVLFFVGPYLVRRLAGASVCPDRTFFAVTSLYFVLSLIAYAFGILSMAVNRISLRGYTRAGVAVFHVVGFLFTVRSLGISAFPVAGGIALILEITILATVCFKTLDYAQSSVTAAAPAA
jgi:O-antigen/teichoic acid export membrane protein